MDKKVILITGATGGLGSAMVKHFENQDVKLALHTFQQDPFEVNCEHRGHDRGAAGRRGVVTCES